MKHTIKEQLEMLSQDDRLNPDRAWVQKHRETLLGQITATTEVRTVQKETLLVRAQRTVGMASSVFFPQKLAAVARPIMTLFLVAGLAIGGWAATVSASYNSIPGDRLYQVKLATENVQKAVSTIVSSDEENVKSDIDRAKRRAQEIRQAVESVQGNPSRKTKVSKSIKDVAVKELEESVRSAEETLRQIIAENGDTAASVAKQVSEDTEIIKETLKYLSTENSDTYEQEKSSQNDEEDAIDAVSDVMKEVSIIGINALATAVEKRNENEYDDHLLKEVMQKKIEVLSDDAFAALQSGEELLAAQTSSTSSTVSELSEDEDLPAIITQDDIDAIAEALEIAEALGAEASELVEQFVFSEAMKKVLELHGLAADMRETVREFKKRMTEAADEPVVNEESNDSPDEEHATSTLADSEPVADEDHASSSTAPTDSTDQ